MVTHECETPAYEVLPAIHVPSAVVGAEGLVQGLPAQFSIMASEALDPDVSSMSNGLVIETGSLPSDDEKSPVQSIITDCSVHLPDEEDDRETELVTPNDAPKSFQFGVKKEPNYYSAGDALCDINGNSPQHSDKKYSVNVEDEQNNNICKIEDVQGNVPVQDTLMSNNNNEDDKESLTGSSTSITIDNWSTNNGSRQPESLTTTRNSSMMLASPAGVFKPPTPMTIADHRLLQSGIQYSPGPMSPYPYGSYYSQYNYPRNYPQIESYSAVLQSMGSHAAQSQLQCNTYGSQYPYGGQHQRSMSVSSSGTHPPPRRSPGDPVVERVMDSSIPHSYLKEERAHSLSSVELSSSKTVSFKDSPRSRDLINSKDTSYKVPSGKEGSLKHRILTRPSDSTPESSVLDVQYGEPSAKRSRYDPSPTINQEDRGSSNLHYPPHFMKGSIIQLTNGELKRVEDLETKDFVQSAEISNDLKIDSSSVVRIDENVERGTAVLGFVVGEHKVQVTVEATLEHPFFVFNQGWSSCDPERTHQRYGLDCHRLSVNDTCISLTHKEVTARAAELVQQQQKMGDNTVYSYGDSVSGNKSGNPSQASDLNNRSQHRMVKP